MPMAAKLSALKETAEMPRRTGTPMSRKRIATRTMTSTAEPEVWGDVCCKAGSLEV
jgi:hypothetical protein